MVTFVSSWAKYQYEIKISIYKNEYKPFTLAIQENVYYVVYHGIYHIQIFNYIMVSYPMGKS